MATNRFIALIGDGRERFSDKELDKEKATEPVVIDTYGVSNAYKYDGYVFLNENWYTKYSKKWQEDPTEIDDLLVSLIKNAHKGCQSDNLLKIQAYLSEPPESLHEIVAVWKGFYDPELKTI